MKQPQLTTPSDISLHEPLRRTLPNGVTIHTLCAAEFEVVRVSFVFRAGSAQQRKAFVATSTANLRRSPPTAKSASSGCASSA